MNKSETYTTHASQSREELREWIDDIVPIEVEVHLASFNLTDVELVIL